MNYKIPDGYLIDDFKTVVIPCSQSYRGKHYVDISDRDKRHYIDEINEALLNGYKVVKILDSGDYVSYHLVKVKKASND